MSYHGKRVQRILDEIEGVKAQYGVSSWEENFLQSIAEQPFLSDKQERILREIEEKVFGDTT